jgi:hypothetical protein
MLLLVSGLRYVLALSFASGDLVVIRVDVALAHVGVASVGCWFRDRGLGPHAGQLVRPMASHEAFSLAGTPGGWLCVCGHPRLMALLYGHGRDAFPGTGLEGHAQTGVPE